MNLPSSKFADAENLEFFSLLRQRINTYFESTNTSKHGNTNMIVKTITMFLLYFIPYFVLLLANITHPFLIISLWVMIGFGMAGIGLCIMHDANHRSYSSRNLINKYLGYSMNLIGANAEIWKLQHNRLHHTYTNLEGEDDDINTPFFLRFSPHKKRLWIHRYQYIYVWFFYGISTLSWVTTKEFMQLYRYRKMGLINGKKKFRKMKWQLIGWKVFYYLYMLVLPLIFIPAPAWLIIVSFLIMHFVTGLLISMVFQTAHVMPTCAYPLADTSGELDHSWAVHEMMTTTNFSPKSKIFTWFIGGLNYQVEHHLFPSICHVHYKKISHIVETTATELGIPYNSEKNFISALRSHVNMLYELGRRESLTVTNG